MKRRQFITLIGGAAAWPLVTRAQQPKVPTIGILVRAVPGSEEFRHLFPEALRDLGYIDGKNIHFEFRSDEGQINRLPGLAAELVRVKVDVIVALVHAGCSCRQAGNTRNPDRLRGLRRPGRNRTGREPVSGPAEMSLEFPALSGSFR